MPFPLDVPVLSDGVVTLRAHHPGDVEAMVEMCSDPEAARWTSVPRPYSARHAQEYVRVIAAVGWAEKNHRTWAVEATDDDGVTRFAGNLDLRSAPVASVGFLLHPWARGRGIMTRALVLAIDWGFSSGGVEAVHWAAHVGNAASLAVAHRAGFTLTGTTPGMLHERGRLLDAWTAVMKYGDAPLPRTTWRHAPTLDGDGVRLRALRDDDVPRIVEAAIDPRTHQWLTDLPRPYGVAQARSYLDAVTFAAATGRSVTWAVAHPDDDRLIGTLAIFDLLAHGGTAGEIGYWSHPDARGRGVMTAALRRAVAYAFDPAGLDRHRLALFAAVGNAASNHVATSAGFTLWGTQRRAERLGDGTDADLNAYELLR